MEAFALVLPHHPAHLARERKHIVLPSPRKEPTLPGQFAPHSSFTFIYVYRIGIYKRSNWVTCLRKECGSED
jgi:hypothetical protein